MMTLERAAELVAKVRATDSYAAIDLFCHFDDVFRLNETYRKDDGKAIEDFAILCGYGVAKNVTKA